MSRARGANVARSRFTRTAGLPAVRSARPVEQRRDLRPETEVKHEARDEQHDQHYPWNHAANRHAILRRHRVNQGKF